ncbi:unnamed protein product, partial [Dovyalis caffra]
REVIGAEACYGGCEGVRRVEWSLGGGDGGGCNVKILVRGAMEVWAREREMGENLLDERDRADVMMQEDFRRLKVESSHTIV